MFRRQICEGRAALHRSALALVLHAGTDAINLTGVLQWSCGGRRFGSDRPDLGEGFLFTVELEGLVMRLRGLMVLAFSSGGP